MPVSVPHGYQASLLSQVNNLNDLSTFAVLEESQPEGSRLLCALTFASRPDAGVVALFNQRCREEGVTPWPEWEDIAFLDSESPTLYLCWQKGFAWWGWILMLLATVALPPLLMAGLWLILPEPIRELISTVINLMVLGLVMFVMMKMMKAITAPEERKELT